MDLESTTFFEIGYYPSLYIKVMHMSLLLLYFEVRDTIITSSWIGQSGYMNQPVENTKHMTDDTKQGATSLVLQVQSVIARVKFPNEETRG
jgi:hypothetical protein